MYYVYRLQSITFFQQFYTGYTADLNKRIECHNNGQVQYTSKYKPWKLLSYIVFLDRKKALDFEKYLKSGSGRAFAKKHF